MEPRIYAERLHFRLPSSQYPRRSDSRSQYKLITCRTGSKDLQMVKISLRVLSHPSAYDLPTEDRNLGRPYDGRMLLNICNEVVKMVVAKFNATELIIKRQQVNMMIQRKLRESAKDINITLDNVFITGLSFVRQYTAAAEAMQGPYRRPYPPPQLPPSQSRSGLRTVNFLEVADEMESVQSTVTIETKSGTYRRQCPPPSSPPSQDGSPFRGLDLLQIVDELERMKAAVATETTSMEQSQNRGQLNDGTPMQNIGENDC